MFDYTQTRRNMIECQLRPNAIIDEAVLNAFFRIPRENFVPTSLRELSYIDEDLKLPGKKYLIEPMILGKLLQSAQLKPEHFTLILGCSTGYVSALISQIVCTVMSVFENEKQCKIAQERIEMLGINNCITIEGNIAEGYCRQAPYDTIIIPGAVDYVPEAILEQLNEDHGRLVTIIKKKNVKKATRFERYKDNFSSVELFDAPTFSIQAFNHKPGFVFS